jgi:hypothetical protein
LMCGIWSKLLSKSSKWLNAASERYPDWWGYAWRFWGYTGTVTWWW